MSAFAVAIGGEADMPFCTAMSAFDPKRTSARISYCSGEASFRLYQSNRLNPTMSVLRLGENMRRREFHRGSGWCGGGVPLAAHAQQPPRMPRIGVLTPFKADDTEGKARLTAFAQGLQQLGWTVGQNIRVDYRWGDGKPATMRNFANELVSLVPDAILANSSAAVSALLEATRTVPIVFALSPTR